MEKLERALVLIPIVMGIMQWVKQTIWQTMLKFMWILTCIVGVLCAYGYVGALEITTMNNTMIIFGGIIVWLAASWLYEATNNTITAIKPTEKENI